MIVDSHVGVIDVLVHFVWIPAGSGPRLRPSLQSSGCLLCLRGGSTFSCAAAAWVTSPPATYKLPLSLLPPNTCFLVVIAVTLVAMRCIALM